MSRAPVPEATGPKVEAIFADVLELPSSALRDDLAMENVDAWDSLLHMELVASLEQGFGVELSFDEIVEMQTLGDVKRVLGRRAGPA